MSQHIYKTQHHSKRPILIRAGWDRPLGGFFMTIEYTDESARSDGETEWVYNNLDQNHPHPTTFDPFQLALDRNGLTIPGQMADEILTDMIDNVGNKIIQWSDDPEHGLLARERLA